MPSISLKNVLTLTTVILFFVLTIWWGISFFIVKSDSQNLIWAASYQIVALWGGMLGLLVISRLWGGTKSVMGQAVISFAVGLLLEVFGQSVFSFYNIILKINIPYPSVADVGFFGSIPFYIYGIILLGKASRVSMSLRSFASKLQTVLIPLAMLSLSYVSFLKNYEIDLSQKTRIFFDFGYPVGQAIYVSIALLVYILSRNILGGIMRKKVLLILAALAIQYIADYTFLYQNLKGTWINGGYGDFIYLLAYFFMSLGLVRLVGIFDADNESE